VNVPSEGRKHLGAAVGSVKHKENHVNGLVQKWVRELSLIALIAKSQPQCAYAAFTSRYRHKFNYFLRTFEW